MPYLSQFVRDSRDDLHPELNFNALRTHANLHFSEKCNLSYPLSQSPYKENTSCLSPAMFLAIIAPLRSKDAHGIANSVESSAAGEEAPELKKLGVTKKKLLAVRILGARAGRLRHGCLLCLLVFLKRLIDRHLYLNPHLLLIIIILVLIILLLLIVFFFFLLLLLFLCTVS
ncbi:hypothetical protein EYF80_024643 [Liparis tanakae]|uniref:Uncharacterized protein n=1 Tax=Liparis tanakae TaxID=230148 RepID=A0A4Z2HJM4_9TELE|nr:hypothetical protein EYF80_024643 [Liparis tanakae]